MNFVLSNSQVPKIEGAIKKVRGFEATLFILRQLKWTVGNAEQILKCSKIYFLVHFLMQGPLNIWTEHSNC